MPQTVVPKAPPPVRAAPAGGLGLPQGASAGGAQAATSAARKDPTAEYAELLRAIPQLAPLGEVRGRLQYDRGCTSACRVLSELLQ